MEKVRREKMQVHEKVYRKVAKHCVFPMLCRSAGSKSRPAKAAGAETPGQMRHEDAKHKKYQKKQKHYLGALLEIEMLKKCTPLRREAHLEVKKQEKL